MLALLAQAASIEPYEPKTYKQAIKCVDHRQWRTGMEDEIKSVNANYTYILVPLPPGRRALRAKWVFRIKRGPMGEILRYKARWVVRGFEQREGIDFNETFASVVKPMSYRAIFAIAAANDWEIHAMDVKTALLYGDVDEEIYVEQPEGFEDGTDRVQIEKSTLWFEAVSSNLVRNVDQFPQILGLSQNRRRLQHIRQRGSYCLNLRGRFEAYRSFPKRNSTRQAGSQRSIPYG